MTEVEARESDSDKRAERAEVDAYVKRNLLRTVVGLILAFIAIAVVSQVYEEEMETAARYVYDAVGLGGLFGVIFVSDSIFSPLPPDIVLVVVANSQLSARWFLIVPAIGLVSVVAGHVGWCVGSYAANWGPTKSWISRLRARHAHSLLRYDRWAVILGAVTPLPFSLICITAGALGMNLRRLSPVTWLRVPRYLVVYAVIASGIAL